MRNLLGKFGQAKLTDYDKNTFALNFESLGLPIATSNENILPDWDPLESWETYFETIKDLYKETPRLRALLTAVMAKTKNPRLTQEKHRKLVQKWVDKHVGNLTLLWPEDLLSKYNDLKSEEERKALKEFLMNWRNTSEQTDDICVAGIKIS